jgi:hypothetical protein
MAFVQSAIADLMRGWHEWNGNALIRSLNTNTTAGREQNSRVIIINIEMTDTKR